MSQPTIFTIGHSTHGYARFLELIRSAGVTAIADVRTSPYSRHYQHFNRETLKETLQLDGIAYSFLGKELGGRPTGKQYYQNGVADYERMAQSPVFTQGLERVLEGVHKFSIALMCSEHDPLDCHRCLLVGRALAERGAAIGHILADGKLTDHREIQELLLKYEGQQGDDLFLSPEERLAEAYRKRARKIAYAEQSGVSTTNAAAE